MDGKEKFVRVGGNLTDGYNDWVDFALDEACASSFKAPMCHDSTYDIVLADILKRFKGTVRKHTSKMKEDINQEIWIGCAVEKLVSNFEINKISIITPINHVPDMSRTIEYCKVINPLVTDIYVTDEQREETRYYLRNDEWMAR